MSNYQSIQMPGVVFMQYIQVNDAGVHIYVTHSAKLYEDEPTLALNLYDLDPDKLSFTESSNRADCDETYTGHWIEVGKTTFLKDMDTMSPMWIQSGMPIWNKIFIKPKPGEKLKKEGNKNIYKVRSAKLTKQEQAQLKKNFIEKYPKYLKKILANYEANLKAGKYKTLAERIQEYKDRKSTTGIKGIFGTVSGVPTKLPFDKVTLNLARKVTVEKWLRQFQMDPKSFKGGIAEMKKALKALL